jgi:integrase
VKAINPRLAADADTARERMDAAGIDLTLAELARQYAEATVMLGDAGSILDAARAYRASHDARLASKPLGEAVGAFIELKEGELREPTLRAYRHSLIHTLAPLAEKPLADVTTSDIEALLEPYSASMRKGHFRAMRAFWRWAAKVPREWCSTAPLDGLEITAKASEADTEILTPPEVRALLEAAEKYSPHAACSYALALFAGVRMEELQKLRWCDIDEEHIEIGASIAKKGQRRLIPVSPTLAAWIAAYRQTGSDPDEHVVGSNWRDVSCAVRRLAGWDVSARLLKKPPKATRGAWKKNAPRHTCASLLVALGEPLESLIFQFGHTGGHDLLRRHYIGRMPKKAALEILATGPKGTKVETTRAA